MTDVLKDEIKEDIAKSIPLRRMGTVQDVANVVKFLASEDSSYVTGQVLNVDGRHAYVVRLKDNQHLALLNFI